MNIKWAKAFIDRRLESPLSQQLQDELRPFGISHFYYSCFFNGPLVAGMSSRKRNNDFSYEAVNSRMMERMRYLATDDLGYLHVLARYFHSYGDADGLIGRSPSRQLEVVTFPCSARFDRNPMEVWRNLDIKTSAFLDVGDENSREIGAFSLHSPDDFPQFEANLAGRERELTQVLHRYHGLFLAEFPLLLNPWLNLGVIGWSAQRTLQLLAEGLSNDEMAERLYLTNRGVDYHLNQLKVILKAENRCHLVAKACAFNLVDLSPISDYSF